MNKVRYTAPLAGAAVAVLAIAGCSGGGSTSNSSASASASGDVVTVNLTQQNNSGMAGTATIRPINNGQQIQVDINVTGEPSGAHQPAHIHQGTCENLNPNPQFFLTDSGTQTDGGQLWVQDGRASAIVTTTMQEIQSTPHAINIHLSPTDLPHYMACGNIPAS